MLITARVGLLRDVVSELPLFWGGLIDETLLKEAIVLVILPGSLHSGLSWTTAYLSVLCNF